MPAPQILQGDQMSSLLRACCEQENPATIRSMVDQTVYTANFLQCAADSLYLQIRAPTSCSPPRSGLCCVVFCQGRRTYLFTTVVRNLEAETQIELERPTEISAERRTSIRVPLGGGLRVAVTTPDGQTAVARPRNLSLSGIFVEFPAEPAMQLVSNTQVDLDLSLGHLQTSVTGIVRRRAGESYGVFFCASAGEQQFEAPDALHHIYTLLRQRRLPRKLLKAAPRPSAGQSVVIPVSRSR